MAATPRCSWHVPVGVACFLLLLFLGLRGGGQEGNPRPESYDAELNPKLKPFYFGVQSCAVGGCHDREESIYLDPKHKKDKFPSLCGRNEITRWNKGDKHKNAYNVLLVKNGRAQLMEKILNHGKPDAEKTPVYKKKECVSCHAVNIPEDAKIDRDIDRSFDISEGVSCVVCHGAYREWVKAHQANFASDQETWRKRPRAEKEKDFGMTDLWNPVRRGQVCASCHVGSKKEKKVVTHEMYAAGHPPLPGLEVATFCEQMPQHWDLIRDKPDPVKKLPAFDAAYEQFGPKGEFERTSLVLASSAATLCETMRLLGEQAEHCLKTKNLEEKSLDLANFDCYACHHDLKVPSWRQQPGHYVGTPGRPQMRPWPTALARLALKEVGNWTQAEKGLDSRLEAVYAAFNAQPFGNCAKIQETANKLQEWLVPLVAKLRETRYDRDKAFRLLHGICAIARQGVPDYDTARELAWAFQVIYGEWKGKGEGDSAIEKSIQALEEELDVKLPKGNEGQPVVNNLPTALERLNKYRPSRFKEIFEALCQRLPPLPKEAVSRD